jgi:ATP-dependent DNA ligase
MLYGFDLLELDGEDLRGLLLGDRKKRLANCWEGAGWASSRAITPTMTAPRSSAKPAAWAWRASCPND